MSDHHDTTLLAPPSVTRTRLTQTAPPMTTTPGRPHPWVAASTAGVRFGITMLPPDPDWVATRDCAQAVEGLGFDSLWVPDHPLALGTAPWTTLAALATVTRTIRLGTLVACAAYGHPVLLARAAADIDRISGGRFVLGLGSGDLPPEFAQLGLAWPPAQARQATLAEAVRIIRALLRGETVTHAGTHFRAAGAALVPPPLQAPWVPLLVAGGGERTTLRLVAEAADATNFGAASWAGGAFTAADVRHKLAALRQRCAAVGRPDDAVLRTTPLRPLLAASPAAAQAKAAALPPAFRAFAQQLLLVGTPEAAVTRVQALVALGFQYVIFLVHPRDHETVHLLAERVLPAVTG